MQNGGSSQGAPEKTTSCAEGAPQEEPPDNKIWFAKVQYQSEKKKMGSSLPVPSRVGSVSECSVPVPSVEAPKHVFFQKQSWLCVHSCSTAARPTSSPTLRLSHFTATAITDRLSQAATRPLCRLSYYCSDTMAALSLQPTLVMDLPAFRLGYGLACYKQAHFFPFLFLLPPGNVFLSVMNVVMQMLMGIPFRGSPWVGPPWWGALFACLSGDPL